MIITINQIIQAFREFSDNHLMLQDFGYGETSEIGTTQQMNFPYLWVAHTPQSSIQFLNKTMIPTLNFYLFVLDQRNDQFGEDENGYSSDNVSELMSDTFQIIQDLVHFISTELNQYGVQLQENINVTPVYDETQDKSFGWYIEVQLKLKHVNCVIPYKTTPPDPVIPPTFCGYNNIEGTDDVYWFNETLGQAGIVSPTQQITWNCDNNENFEVFFELNDFIDALELVYSNVIIIPADGEEIYIVYLDDLNPDSQPGIVFPGTVFFTNRPLVQFTDENDAFNYIFLAFNS
jgi:hypothetical protein